MASPVGLASTCRARNECRRNTEQLEKRRTIHCKTAELQAFQNVFQPLVGIQKRVKIANILCYQAACRFKHTIDDNGKNERTWFVAQINMHELVK